MTRTWTESESASESHLTRFIADVSHRSAVQRANGMMEPVSNGYSSHQGRIGVCIYEGEKPSPLGRVLYSNIDIYLYNTPQGREESRKEEGEERRKVKGGRRHEYDDTNYEL